MVVALLLITSCGFLYHNPSQSLNKVDLLGVWEAKYSQSTTDRLELRMDGFTQHYQDVSAKDHTYERTGQEWWVEHLPQGFTRVHLKGALFLPYGIESSMETYLHDPFVNESVTVDNEVILVVQVSRTGELYLYHLTVDADEGAVSVFGNDADAFHRVVSK